MAVVVLPTPPFWFAIAITCVTGASPRIIAGVGDGRRGGRGLTRMLLLAPSGRAPRLSTEQGTCSPFCGYVDDWARRPGTHSYHARRRRSGAVLAQRQGSGERRAHQRRAHLQTRRDARTRAAGWRSDSRRPATRSRKADGAR